ncbi:MAG TPA: hypothetical protein PK993_02260 [Clostridia bacterium]|nr:hypothetical protein [Clostridia bacterium]
MNNDEKFGCLKIEEMMFDIDEMSNEELAKIEEEIIKNKNELRKIIDYYLDVIENNVPMNNENINNENFIDVLPKILEKQYQHSIIRTVRNIKRTREMILSNEVKFEKYINEQAKKFNQSINILNEDINQYSGILEDVKNKIDKIKKALMINKEEVQFIEYKKIMSLYKKRDERRVLKKSDEYKEYRTQINNLSRELMKEIENESPNEAEIKRLNIEIDKMEKEDRLNICEIEIQELKKEIIDSRKLGIEIDKNIDQLTSNIKDYLEKLNRDLELVLYENINKKENFIMRFLSKLLNKIDGETKFKEQVVKITKQKINKIKFSYLPELYVEIESDGIDLVSGVLEKKLRITKQCIEDEELKMNAKNIIDSGLNNYKKIIDEGNYRRAESIEVQKL